MRKADYAALAALIRQRIAMARLLEANNSRETDKARYAGFAIDYAKFGREFAARASVDRAEFLKACGIDP